MIRKAAFAVGVVLFSCSGPVTPLSDGGNAVDAGGIDAGGVDAGGVDAGGIDAGIASHSVSFGTTAFAAGVEQTLCVTKRLDNATSFHAGTIRAVGTGGWLETIVYLVNDSTESATPTACTPLESLATAKPVLFTRAGDETVQLPDGTGVEIGAQQMVRIELHGLNETASSADFDFTVTFTKTVATRSASLLISLLPDIDLPSGPSTTLRGTVPFPADVTGGEVAHFTGFTHALGTGVTAGMNGSTVYAPVPFEWNAPASATPFPITIVADGGITLACDWNNMTGSRVRFGAGATEEICLLRTWVTPASTQHLCIRSEQSGGVSLCCPGHVLCAQIF